MRWNIMNGGILREGGIENETKHDERTNELKKL